MNFTKISFAKNQLYHIEEMGSNSALQPRKAMLFMDGVKVVQETSPKIAYPVDNQYKFRLDDILSNAKTFKFTTPKLPEQGFAITEIKGLVQELEVRTANYADAFPAVGDKQKVLGGKLPETLFMLNGNDYLDGQFPAFLTIRKYFVCGENEPVLLSFLTNIDTEITAINVYTVLFYENGDSDKLLIWNSINTFNLESVYTLSFWTTDVLNNATKPVASLELWVETQDNEILCNPFTIVIDNSYYQEETLLAFENNFGVPEIIRCTGSKTQSNEITDQKLKYNGITKNVNARYTEKITLTLGETHAHEVPILLDNLSHTNNIFLLTDDGLSIPLTREFKSIKKYDSTTLYDNPELEFAVGVEFL